MAPRVGPAEEGLALQVSGAHEQNVLLGQVIRNKEKGSGRSHTDNTQSKGTEKAKYPSGTGPNGWEARPRGKLSCHGNHRDTTGVTKSK